MPRMHSPSMGRCFLVAFLLPCLFALFGCQKQDDLPPTHPASGKVIYQDGVPMKGGTIQFLSTSPDSPLITSGEIDENGAFTLSTLKDKHKATGAVEGDYQVSILPPQTDDHQPVTPIHLPGTYTIKSGENKLPTMTIPRASH